MALISLHALLLMIAGGHLSIGDTRRYCEPPKYVEAQDWSLSNKTTVGLVPSEKVARATRIMKGNAFAKLSPGQARMLGLRRVDSNSIHYVVAARIFISELADESEAVDAGKNATLLVDENRKRGQIKIVIAQSVKGRARLAYVPFVVTTSRKLDGIFCENMTAQ